MAPLTPPIRPYMEFTPRSVSFDLKIMKMGLNLLVVRSYKEEIKYFSLAPLSRTTVWRASRVRTGVEGERNIAWRPAALRLAVAYLRSISRIKWRIGQNWW